MPKWPIQNLVTRKKTEAGTDNERVRKAATPTAHIAPKQKDGDESESDEVLKKNIGLGKYGLFLLNKNDGQQAQSYTLDVVAVHGLGGDAYRTWTHANGKLWLRDFLQEDLPKARVFTYGYNSTYVFSRETGNLRDYARDLLESIRSERTSPNERARPLCFVCHSMGGIVVKQALILATNEAELYPEFMNSASGVVFLATPHQGSPLANYASILSQIANIFVVGSQLSRLTGPVRSDLLHGLKMNEGELLRIAQEFRVHTRSLGLTSCIEQKSMSGLDRRIVDDKSGFIGASNERIVPMVDCDHREICRHGERTNNYKKLLSIIGDNMTSPLPATRTLQEPVKPAAATCLHINVPHMRVSNFVMRNTLLEEMRRQILNDSQPRTVVLLGMGGAGKTQLALEICRQAEEIYDFEAIIWIDASSPVSVEAAYMVIAKKISNIETSNEDKEGVISLVQDTLRTWTRPWLVVFDNYDDPRAFQRRSVRHYIPSMNNGRILFTSRHEDSARLGHCIAVSEMSDDESLSLLLQRPPANESEMKEGLEIVSTLGRLALALDQAGAYIRARDLKLRDFIRHYNRRREIVLRETPDEWEYRRDTDLSVFTTWELSFDQIRGDAEEKRKKHHFITLAASFTGATMFVSERYFRAHFDAERPEWMDIFTTEEEWDSEKLGDILAEFKKLSLLRFPDQQIKELQFSFHPVVCDWIRLRNSHEMKEKFNLESIAAFVHCYEIFGVPFEEEDTEPELLLATMEYISASRKLLDVISARIETSQEPPQS